MSGDQFKGRVIVYSIIGCPHCLRSKASLRELKIPFVDVSIDQYDPKIRNELFERTKQKTVPQIFFNEEFIGGNDELQKLIKSKEDLNAKLEMLRTCAPSSNAPSPPDASLRLDDTVETDWSCEADEYAVLVHEMRKAGLVCTNRKYLIFYSNTFTGENFVKWLVESKQLDRERAMEMGNILLRQHIARDVRTPTEKNFKNEDIVYRLLEDEDSSALNAGALSECKPSPAAMIGEEVRRLILKAFADGVSADGRRVDYKKLGASEAFKKFVRFTQELHRVDIESASREEKLAFFINIYNSLVIHATVVKGPPTNMIQRWRFFNTVRYVISGHEYNLQDIENGVLRANRKGVAQLFKPFGSEDPRLKVALKNHEPLIHFALNCGAKSCPPIKTFSAANIKEELTLACKAFLETDDAIAVDSNRKTVSLSKIFDWYGEDFGKNNKEIVQWIEKNMDDSDKREALRRAITGKFKIGFLKYDWGLNS